MSDSETTNCKRELVIEVPAEEVQKEAERVTRHLQRRARLPGFRPGKAPLTLIQQRFREEIREEVLRALVPEYVRRRMQEENLEPVASPQIEEVSLETETQQPLRFKAVFEVIPPFDLSDYTELEVEVVEPAVSEEQVEASLKQLQEQQAVFAAVEDRPLEDGDFAVMSLTGKPQAEKPPAEKPLGGQEPSRGQPAGAGPVKLPVKLEEALCEIGGSDTLPAFTEHLRGARPGEERSFPVSYPEDFNDQRLAGRTVLYIARVNAIKQKQTPELNDEFARDLGRFTTLEEVRASIRQNLLEQERQRAEQQAKEQMIDRLVERHDFPVPELLVDRQVQARLERSVRQLAAQGVDPARLDLDWARLRSSHLEGARRDVRAGLLLERIAEREEIQVSEEELRQETENLAQQAARGGNTAVTRARLTRPEVADKIKSRLRNDKTLDLLYRKARKIAGHAGEEVRPQTE